MKVQPQFFFHHAAAKRRPVDRGISRQMRVVIAHGAIHFGAQGHGGDARAGDLQTRQHIGDFFADRGGAGGLAVGAAEHGLRRPLRGHGFERGHGCIQRGQEYLFARDFQLQGMAGVVDVFAGAGKVDEFAQLLQARKVFEHPVHAHIGLATNPVFHGFDIVVGDFFYRFDGGGIGFAKVGHHLRQMGAFFCAQRGKFWQARVA